jgi:hypothetical protein
VVCSGRSQSGSLASGQVEHGEYVECVVGPEIVTVSNETGVMFR